MRSGGVSSRMQPFRAHQLAHQAEECPALSESTTYIPIGPLPTGQDVLTESIEAEVPPGSRPTQAQHAAPSDGSLPTLVAFGEANRRTVLACNRTGQQSLGYRLSEFPLLLKILTNLLPGGDKQSAARRGKQTVSSSSCAGVFFLAVLRGCQLSISKQTKEVR